MGATWRGVCVLLACLHIFVCVFRSSAKPWEGHSLPLRLECNKGGWMHTQNPRMRPRLCSTGNQSAGSGPLHTGFKWKWWQERGSQVKKEKRVGGREGNNRVTVLIESILVIWVSRLSAVSSQVWEEVSGSQRDKKVWRLPLGGICFSPLKGWCWDSLNATLKLPIPLLV